MKTFIATETIMYKSENELFVSNSFKRILERYKKNFGTIILCTRVYTRKRIEIPESYDVVTGIIDRYIEIKSLTSFIKGEHNSYISMEIYNSDFIIARVPSIVAYKTAKYAIKYKKKYLVEVVGCAWDAYWNYNLYGKFIAPIAYKSMKETVKKADYAMYVTESFLQTRYPCKVESIHCSNVFIKECDNTVFNNRIMKINRNEHKVNLVLITCAAVDVVYKGQEYVIRAIEKLKDEGFIVEYRMAGSGHPERLREIAKKCGVDNQIKFLGALSREDVLQAIDEADIYIQPSLQEGLPRAVIEAMSRACPVIGARTAGIPELIDEECVFKRASEVDIVKKIVHICNSNMKNYATRNFNKSKEFLSVNLEERREVYYKKIMSDVIGK